MAETQTWGAIIKLGDLPLEQREQMLDVILYSAEHESEFLNEVNHKKLDANKTSLTFMRTFLPEIDKTSERYKNGLLEGITPSPEQINEAQYTVRVRQIGWYHRLTDVALDHAFFPLQERCEKILGNKFKSYNDEKIADAYLSTANVISGTTDLTSLANLLKLRTILRKGGAKPFGRFFKLIVPPEVGDAMLVSYQSILTHTTEKESVVDGELGEVAGFRIITSVLQAFEGTLDSGNTKFPFLAYGKNSSGEFAVTTVAYDNMSAHIILKKPGENGDDPLNQRASIGLKVDGHGFYVSDDAVAVHGTTQLTGTSVIVPKFDDANRSHKVASSVARAITPEYDFVKINQYSSGTTANTLAIKASKPDGSAWAFAASGTGKANVVSGNTSVATVAFAAGACTLTAVAPGFTTLAITDNDNPNNVTVMTVQVLDGVGSGIVA